MSEMTKQQPTVFRTNQTVDASSDNSRKADPTTPPRDAKKKVLRKDRKAEELKKTDFLPQSTLGDAATTDPSQPQAEPKKPAAITALPLPL
jgi:hypothetical protein